MSRQSTVATDGHSNESENRNEAIVRRLFEEALDSGRLSHVDDLLADDHVGSVPSLPDNPRGPAAFKRFVVWLRRAVFDLEVTVDEVVANGATVRVRWTASGRHERPILGVEPTCVVGAAGREPGGRRVTLSSVTVVRVEESTIQESRTEWTSREFE